MRSFAARRDHRGYDPYDALNSPLIRALTLGTKWGRIAWTQFFRHCPVNLRPVLGFPRQQNPAALGLFLWGLAKMYSIRPDAALRRQIASLVDDLEGSRSRGFAGSCWGYDFPWQSRGFYLPAYTPTVVATSFNGHALLDLFQLTGDRGALDLALDTLPFLLNDLNRTWRGDSFCFSYSPVDRTRVHNANVLGASLLARCHRFTRSVADLDAAHASLAYTMEAQRPDGSWYYGEAPFQRWIDSFHTGFNLQAIRYFLTEGLAGGHTHAFEKGVAYYAGRFFLDDGTPQYYAGRTYPLDVHAPSQAIAFFSGMGEDFACLTDRVLDWLMANLYNHQRGCFHFRRGRWLTNRIPYMRWSQAWAFHALTTYAHCRYSQTGE